MQIILNNKHALTHSRSQETLKKKEEVMSQYKGAKARSY